MYDNSKAEARMRAHRLRMVGNSGTRACTAHTPAKWQAHTCITRLAKQCAGDGEQAIRGHMLPISELFGKRQQGSMVKTTSFCCLFLAMRFNENASKALGINKLT